MIGIIVTGHGQFATGLVSALKLLAGEPEALLAVDFEAGDDIGRLEEKLKAAIESLGGEAYDGGSDASSDGILVMTDLRGGSPFNVASRLSMEHPGVEVLTGSNLGMLVEAYMARQMAQDVKTLAVSTAASGKDQVGYFEKELVGSADDEDEIELD